VSIMELVVDEPFTLTAQEPVFAKPRAPKAKRRRKSSALDPNDPKGWNLTEHVCAECFGRVLAKTGAGETIYRCACCGHHGAHKVSTVCACGMTFKRRKASEPVKTIGIHCHANPNKNPASPAEFIASDHV